MCDWNPLEGEFCNTLPSASFAHWLDEVGLFLRRSLIHLEMVMENQFNWPYTDFSFTLQLIDRCVSVCRLSWVNFFTMVTLSSVTSKDGRSWIQVWISLSNMSEYDIEDYWIISSKISEGDFPCKCDNLKIEWYSTRSVTQLKNANNIFTLISLKALSRFSRKFASCVPKKWSKD